MLKLLKLDFSGDKKIASRDQIWIEILIPTEIIISEIEICCVFKGKANISCEDLEMALKV